MAVTRAELLQHSLYLPDIDRVESDIRQDPHVFDRRDYHSFDTVTGLLLVCDTRQDQELRSDPAPVILTIPSPSNLKFEMLADQFARYPVAFSVHNQKSPLLRLPAEIRGKIYGHVLAEKALHMHVKKTRKETVSQVLICDCTSEDDEHEAICKMRQKLHEANHSVVVAFDVRHASCSQPYRDGLVLLSICRQIYMEAAKLPFILNTFIFDTRNDMSDWLTRLKLEQKTSMKSMVIYKDSTKFCSISNLDETISPDKLSLWLATQLPAYYDKTKHKFRTLPCVPFRAREPQVAVSVQQHFGPWYWRMSRELVVPTLRQLGEDIESMLVKRQ